MPVPTFVERSERRKALMYVRLSYFGMGGRGEIIEYIIFQGSTPPYKVSYSKGTPEMRTSPIALKNELDYRIYCQLSASWLGMLP